MLQPRSMHRPSTWMFVVVALAATAAAACGASPDPNALLRGVSDKQRSTASDGGSTASASADDGTDDPTSAGGGSDPAPDPRGCTSCHGDDTRSPVAGADPLVTSAPPHGTKGETSPTSRAVGAHMKHVDTSGGLMAPLACKTCHVVPSRTDHSNGKVDVVFGALATRGGSSPSWNGTSCSATYCHGTSAPQWTSGTAMTCTSCHGAPPSTGSHLTSAHRVACSTCHGTGYSSSTVNQATHLDGVANAGGAGSSITYNAGSCTPSCHGTRNW